MTYLELAQMLRSEAGLSGTGPASVQSQVGMDLKICNWIKRSWIDIQESRFPWRFLWKNDGAFTTTIGVRGYDPASFGFAVGRLHESTVTVLIGNVWSSLVPMEYEAFRQCYLADAVATSGRPTVFTVAPDDSLLFDQLPDAAYQIRFEYSRSPQVLVQNSDVPIIPSSLHDVIVYHALAKYAIHDEAQITFQDADARYRRWLRRLEREQLPATVVAGCLA